MTTDTNLTSTDANQVVSFRRSGDGYIPVEVTDGGGHDRPEPGVYHLYSGNRRSRRLELKPYLPRFDVDIPIYTNNIPKEMAEYIITNLDHVPNSNVMITGRNGMGKTLTAQSICNGFIDEGYAVYLIDSMIPIPVIRRYADASNGRRVVFLFDDVDHIYGNYKGIDAFVAFLSDPLMRHAVSIITTSNNIQYSRLNVVDGRPSRSYYRLDLPNITLAKSPELITALRKDIERLPGKKWRAALLDEYLEKTLAVVNFDLFNRVAEIMKTSKTEQQARTHVRFLNVNVGK